MRYIQDGAMAQGYGMTIMGMEYLRLPTGCPCHPHPIQPTPKTNNMTAKEKAQDLFVVFYEGIPDFISNEEAKHIAKDHAIKCVQELKTVTNECFHDFWIEIEAEIETI